MNIRRTLIPSLLALAAFSGHSYAALLKVGVNFMGRNAGAATLGPDEIAGVDAQTDWNNLGNNIGGEPTGNFQDPNFNNMTSSGLFTEDGLAGTRGTSGVTLSLTTNDAWNSDGGTGTPNEKLMKGQVKAGNPVGTTLTITLSGLTQGTRYKFLAYTAVNNFGAIGDLSLTGASAYSTYYVQEENSFDGTFTPGNSTDSNNRSVESDYSQWDTVQADTNGKLTFTAIYQGRATNTFNADGFGVAGLQLIELPPLSTGDVYWNKGNVAGTWDTTAQNWATDAAGVNGNATFATNNTVHFTNLGTSGARVVTVDAGGVTPGGIDVNNASGNDYTIQGGPILGAGVLTKDGTGALTLTGANQFTGNFTIKHGTVNVSTIGDASTAGNLGQGALLTLGDTAGANDAVLNYTGSTATASRALAVGSNGGVFNTSAANQTLTLSNISGTGNLAKNGVGALAFNGTTAGFSGGIAVNGGALSIRTMNSGSGLLSLNSGTAFNLTGPGTLTDARTLFINGNASVGVTDAAGNYALTADFNDSNHVLTKTGNGRLELAGGVSFAQLPVVSGGTLALTKEGSISLPSGTITLGAGARLEVVPGALGAANPVTLNGGSLRLGHQGLQGYYFTGGYNQNDWLNAMNSTVYAVASSHATIGTPNFSARTTTGGQTNLDFSNGNYGNGAPFANQGVGDLNDIRAIFTGKIRIDSAGATTFFTASDDGSAIFIDGQRIVNNNAFQGANSRQGTITLTAGLHDILMYFYEGGGGAGLLAEYTPAGGTRQTIPNSVLLSGDSVSYTATNVTVTPGAPSSVESGAALAQLGNLNLPANTLLTLNGSMSFQTTALTGSSHQVAVTGFNANATLGALSGPTNLTKTGNGNLIFVLPPTGSTVASNGGLVVAMDSGSGNPLAATPLTFANGGGYGMSATAGGSFTFTNPVSSTSDLTIAAGTFGNQNFAATAITFSPSSGGLVAPAGNTLTIRSNDSNVSLAVTPQITGTGNVVTEEGTLTLSAGVSNVGGNFSNRIANTTVNGNVNTNALLQEGNINSFGTILGNTLISGSLPPGSLMVNGTVNATSVTTTRGTLTVTGTTTNTGALTGNGNGTMNLAASTHASAALSGNATLNASGTFVSTGALTLASATASLNGVSSAASVSLTSSSTLNVRSSLASPAGITANLASTINFDAGGTNTATVTGGDISLTNLSTVHVSSGTADLTNVAVHAAPQIITQYNNALGGRLFTLLNGARLDVRDVNVANQLFNRTSTPGVTLATNLTGALSFGDDNAFKNFFSSTDQQVDLFTAAFVGRFQAPSSGTFTLGTLFNDDQAAIWLDSNQDGVFQAGEKVVNVDGCCGAAVTGTTPSLVAGQFYNVLYGVQDTGGGGSLGGSINGSTLNPSVQTGQFSYLDDNQAGANFQIDSGTELRAKSFDGVTSVKIANNGTVTLTNKGSATASNADRIQVTGTGSTANVFLGDNNVLSIGELLVASGAVVNIDKPSGATNGGRLVLTGNVTGFTGIHTNIGSSSINVSGASLIVNTPLDGTGMVSGAIFGTIGGNSSINMAVNVTGSATLAPGDPATNGGMGTLTTGDFTDDGNFLADLKNKTAGNHDQLNVNGVLTLNNANLQLAISPSFTANPGDEFPLILNDGGDLVFGAGFSQGSSITVGVNTFNIVYDHNYDGGGIANDVGLVFVIPEPGALAILLGGFATLVGFRRSRRRA